MDNKFKVVNEISKYAKVFISSEEELPIELQKYELKVPKHLIHHVIAYSSMFFGESATMASESAVLGVPAIYIDNEGRGYTDEQEKKYGLVSNFTESEQDQEKSIKKAIEIICSVDYERWKSARQRLLKEKIDLTSYLEDFITNYDNMK